MTRSPSAAAWSLDRRRATCLLDGLPSTVELDRPQAGIEVRLPGAAGVESLLGLSVDASWACVDAWSRGADLTAVYETDAARLRATAMWRAAPPWLAAGAAPGIWCREVVVSAQTSLLEAVPHIAVVADMAAGSVTAATLRAGRFELAPLADCSPHGFFVTGPGERSILFLVHPLDARHVEAQVGGDRVRITARLFPAPVEKGVLMRSRVVAAIGPAAGGMPAGSWAATVAAAFAASPPVLTT